MAELLDELRCYLDEPTARGLANALSRAIREGLLLPGTKLPPIRRVATDLGLAPATVAASWALLVRAGAIQTDGRRGSTIVDTGAPGSQRYRRALEQPGLFAQDLSTGVPDPALLPDLSAALGDLTTAGTPGGYLDDPVLPELIDVLRADWPYDSEAITVVDGAMDGVELAARTLLRFGDRVIVEHPCFPPLLDLLDAIGAQVVGIPLDEQGMRVQPLVQALASPVAAVFLQPRGQNPTGVSLDPERAAELATALSGHDAEIIEDDSVGAVAATPAISLGTWLASRTLHIRSFSKSHGPDLRLAALTGPHRLMNVIVQRRQLGQGWSSRLLQRILLNLLTDQRAVEQVAHAREEYQRRRVLLVDALAGQGIAVGGIDGLNLWIPVHDASAAAVRLASQGIAVAQGLPFAVLRDPEQHIRVTSALVADGHTDLAARVAAAAEAGARRMGR